MRPKNNKNNKDLDKKIHGLNLVLKKCGGTQISVAKKFGVSQQAVWLWLLRGAPLNRLNQFIEFFGEDIKYDLWPDVFKKNN